MSAQSPDPKAPKPEADQKVPETVLLTAEELRAIAGGKVGPMPVSKGIIHNPDKPGTPLH